MVGYSFLDDSFIRNPMIPVYPGANQPCRLLILLNMFAFPRHTPYMKMDFSAG